MTAQTNQLTVQPYLFFDGQCEAAVEFYRKTLGAEVEMMMRFKDCPDPQPGMIPPGSEDKIMHASFRIGETIMLASDGRCEGRQKLQGFSLCLNLTNEADADRFFNALADGGQVQMPLTKTFYSPRFGMVEDRFGISWMIYVKQ
jgi:PhnB protein